MISILVITIILIIGFILGYIISFKLLYTYIKGDRGPQGSPGPMGVSGPSGYSPVKGLDYYTTEDKEELINEIVKRLGGEKE